MKKCDLLLAGAMLLGFGATAQAQEQLFFFGFEDGTASFTDSANALDSITQLQYYSHKGSNGGGLKPEEFELGPTYDTTMLVLNGISPNVDRGDTYDIIEDLEGGHRGEFEAMGAEGGMRYFKYMASGEGDPCEDYKANLFVRALPISDYTSYRLSMYIKASAAEGQMNIDLLRGFYNSEKQFSMSGEQNSGEFKLVKNNFETERWERVTMMSYYQNDSVANRYMYQAGYWWENSWLKNIDGTDYNMIVQPDQYFVRLSFSGPGVTYYVDDMALTKSWIGGAEYYQNIMRVDFGYDTNLAELCNASPLKAIKLPTEYFKISGTDNLTGKYFDEIPVSAAEYHNDGYLYMWIDEEESFDYYEDVKVSFTNPEDKGLQLKYDGSLYPMALDTNWVNAGKIVPDFAGEPAFFNPSVTALSMEQMPPVYESSEPEDGSFNLATDTRSIDITFNKNIYVKVGQYDPADTTSVIVVMRAAGSQEIWVPTAYNADTYTVTFSRQEGNTSSLAGDYEFDIVQARATARTPQAEKKTITLSFGEAGTAPVYYLNDPFSAKDENGNLLNVSGSVPYGFIKSDDNGVLQGNGAAAVGGSRLMYFGEGGEFMYGMYLCQRAASTEGTVTYGEMEGYELTLPAGQIQVTFNAGGWDGATPDLYFTMYSADDPETLLVDETIKVTKAFKANEVVTGSTSCRFVVDIPAAGNYILKWTNRSGWSGNTVANINVSNIFSAAYQYVQAYNEALAAAQGTIASAEANAIYGGEYLNTFKATIATKEGFKSTSPTAYNNIVAEIKAATADMSARMKNVDNYYKAYNAAIGIDTLYQDSLGYNELVAYAAVKKAIADYAELDVTVKNNDELNAITAEVNGLTKAMTDRCAIIDEFDANIADAIDALEEQTLFADIAEYKALQSAYNANKDAAKFAITDDELKAINTALSNAISSLNNKVAAASALTTQVKSLAEMAEALEVDFGAMTEDLASQLALELEDNQALANVYKLGIKAALETMMAGDGIDEAGMDMSGFIQNSILYTAIKGYSTPDYQNNPHNGGNAVKFSDQMSSQPEKLMPGWTIESQGGNVYMMNLNTGDVSDSQLALDWGANVTFTQELTNLPAGKYSFSIAPICDAANQLTGEIVFIQETEQGQVVDTLNMSSDINPDRMISFDYYGGDLKLFVHFVDANTWSRYNEINGLTLIEPLKGYDYAAAAEASKAAMDAAYTGVGSVAAPSKVQFYNLNGMQVAEPNKGVNIRISTGANGQRIVEKVLVK